MTKDNLSTHDHNVLNRCFNPNLPYDDSETIELEKAEDDGPENVKQLELDAVQLAEEGRYDEALPKLEEAVRLAPERASVYNNRAQLHRLRGDSEAAMRDLCKAIELASTSSRSKFGLRQAYTQRGLIHRLLGDDDRAREDFEAATKLGCRFAQQQLIALNPYAAMCNQMLSEMIGRLRRGEDSVF